MLREASGKYEIKHLAASLLPFKYRFRGIWVRRKGCFGSSARTLREYARTVSEGVRDVRKLSNYRAQASLEVLIGLDELVLAKIFVRQLGELFELVEFVFLPCGWSLRVAIHRVLPLSRIICSLPQRRFRLFTRRRRGGRCGWRGRGARVG
jgi:hypothetical protein